MPFEKTVDAHERAPFGSVRRAVGDFLSPASFWLPEHLSDSAWIEHAPFAFWLIEAHRPATLVELGTHWGFSFFGFCQAVRALGLETRCFAVDTWRGDDHAGWYGEEVFTAVSEHNEGHYAAFARLVRTTFDEALPLFAPGSIDLLHIDGRHFYEDVRHDFDVWLPKMSPRGIVVFHDTAVHEREFGVHRLWAELRQTYPHFEFLHGHGLGILGVGAEFAAGLRALFAAESDEDLIKQIRLVYAALGSGLNDRLNQRKLLARKDEELVRKDEELARKEERNAAVAAELARLNGELAAERTEIARLTAASAAQAAELDAMHRSASWRITRPLRLATDTARLIARDLRRRR